MLNRSWLIKCWRLFILLVSLSNVTATAQVPENALMLAIRQQEERMLMKYRLEVAQARLLYEMAVASNCATCITRAGYMYGKYLWADGLYQDGLNYLFPALTRAKGQADYETVADCANIIGNTYYYQAYYDSALHYFEIAFKAFEAADDYAGQIRILHDISLMFHRKGDFKKTIEYIFINEQLEAQHPEVLAEIESYGAMGSLLNDSLYYLEKINKAHIELDRFRLSGDKNGISRAYFNLGKAYSQLKNPLRAARFYIKMCEAQVQAGKIPEWQYVAMAYQDAAVKDSTFYYYHQSLKMKDLATRLYNDWIVELIGDAHLHFDRPDSAIYYYDIAMRSNKELNNRLTIVGQHRNYVRAFTQLGDFQKAQYHLDQGLKLARQVSLIHVRNLYKEGTTLFEKMGDFKQAYQYQGWYSALSDSIHRSETAVNLARLQVDFKTSIKEREVERLTQQSEIKDARIRARNLQIGLAITLVALVGSGAAFYFLRFRQKKKMSELLEQKNRLIEEQNTSLLKQNKEKEVLLAEVHHRVKNNLQVMSSLINIKARTTDQASKVVLDDVVNRIYALGLIYEMLYNTDDLSNINLKEYLSQQFVLLFKTLNNFSVEVKQEISIEPIWVDVDTAMNIGLINNELITNTMKYAFTPDQPDRRVKIHLYRQNGTIKFEISDNGLSLFRSQKEIKSSFGLRFVEQIVTTKLRGKIEIAYNKGLSVCMSLKPIKSMKHEQPTNSNS